MNEAHTTHTHYPACLSQTRNPTTVFRSTHTVNSIMLTCVHLDVAIGLIQNRDAGRMLGHGLRKERLSLWCSTRYLPRTTEDTVWRPLV